MNINNSKVSFSVRSKPSSKPNSKPSRHDEDQPTKEFVTEFDPNKTLTDSKKRRLIIPPKVNEGRLLKNMKNLELSISQANKESDQLQWELEKKADAEDKGKISFGLNIRNSNNNSNSNQDATGHSIESMERLASKDFKHDLERLPDDDGFEQYEDMPVEEFGAALLGGLGWYEGRGIGRNSKGNVKIKEFGKKSFVSDDVIINKDKEKNGLKNVKASRVSEIDDKDKQVKHQERQKQVDKRSIENEKKVDKRSRVNEKKVDKPSRETEKREISRDKGRVSWLRSHIRVRIISKDFKRGRFYLKKGEVVDVVGPTTCDIAMDEGGELVQGVDQDALETALPRRGGPVLVLYGRHKGIYGNLVDKDLDRETGVVRDADTQELLDVKLEQIAEYIGDPTYIGY